MNRNSDIWRQYYEKALARKHLPRTEFAAELNKSSLKVGIDCGCGVGSDILYLSQLGYRVYGFDINSDSVAICKNRFQKDSRVEVSESSFEDYSYPDNGLILANSSLFFADPSKFERTWDRLKLSLAEGGVFAGDFMGINDSWASGYRSPTTPMSRQQVRDIFDGFDVIRFHERDELGETAIGKTKHWHTFSVVAVKHTE